MMKWNPDGLSVYKKKCHLLVVENITTNVTAYREENTVLFRKNVSLVSPLAWHPDWEGTVPLTPTAPSQAASLGFFDGMIWQMQWCGATLTPAKLGQVVFLVQCHCNCADGAAIRRMKLTMGHKKLWPCVTPERCFRNLNNVLDIWWTQHSASGSKCQCDWKSVPLKGQMNSF